MRISRNSARLIAAYTHPMSHSRFKLIWLALALCGIVMGCDPAKHMAIAVTPAPSADPNATGQRVLALVTRIAQRHALEPFEWKEVAFERCFSKRGFYMCGKQYQSETHLRLWQVKTFGFSPPADSLRRELLDSLRSTFGAQQVRECKWRTAPDPRQSGCTVVVPSGTP